MVYRDRACRVIFAALLAATGCAPTAAPRASSPPDVPIDAAAPPAPDAEAPPRPPPQGCAAGGIDPDGIDGTVLASPPPPSHLSEVWANDGGDKVTQDELRATKSPAATKNSVWNGTRIAIFGARNEVVGFNVVLEAATEPANAVSVAFARLTGPGGAVIGSTKAPPGCLFDWTTRRIELFHVRYLTIKGLSLLSYETYDERHVPKRLRRPFDAEGRGQGGWTDRPDHDKAYPDLAVPLELMPSFDVAQGESQSVWVDVTIAKDATPGLYAGKLVVREGGVATRVVPVELTVRGFTLPDAPSAKTMVYLGYADINRRYLGMQHPNPGPLGDASIRIRDRHFMLAHRHRLSLVDGEDGPSPWSQDAPRPEWVPRLDGSLFTAGRGYDGPGAGTGNGVYSIGTYGTWGWKEGGEAAMKTHAAAWSQWFTKYSPATEAFLYLIDESDDYPQIETWAKWLASGTGAGGAVKSFATISLPDATAHTPSLDIAASRITVGIPSAWQAAAAAWKAAPAKRFYAYNGIRPASGSFAIEDDGVALRELAWGQYKVGIARWFFWESTYYDNFQANLGDTNVLRSAHTFGGLDGVDPVLGETGWNYSNGDGVLFYPGTDTVFPADSQGLEGPIASLRLKHWRRGLQDVDYLVLAAAKDPAAVQKIVQERVPKALWEYGVADPDDPTWVRTDISWSTDPDDWEAARKELADLIEGKPRAAGSP